MGQKVSLDVRGTESRSSQSMHRNASLIRKTEISAHVETMHSPRFSFRNVTSP